MVIHAVVPTLGRLKGRNHEAEAHQATQQNLVLKSVTKPKSLGLTLLSVTTARKLCMVT